MFPRRLEYPAEGGRISGGHLAFGPGDAGGDPDPTDLSPMARPFRRRGVVLSSRAGRIFLDPAAFRRAQGPFGPAAAGPGPLVRATTRRHLPWPRSQVASPASRLACSRAATSVVLQAGEVRSCSSLSPSEDLCVWTFMKKKRMEKRIGYLLTYDIYAFFEKNYLHRSRCVHVCLSFLKII